MPKFGINSFDRNYSYTSAIIILFFVISGTKLLYLNCFKIKQDIKPAPEMTFEQKQKILNKIKAIFPRALSEIDLYNPDAFVKKLDFNSEIANHGKIMLATGRVSKYIYPLKLYRRIFHFSSCFYPRPYVRTLIYIDELGYVMFPGILPQDMAGRDFVFIGRQRVYPQQIYEGRNITEAIAIIPIDKTTGVLKMENILLANNDRHLELLEWLKPKS